MEKHVSQLGIHHITTDKQTITYRARQCEQLFSTVKEKANNMGMKVNSNKTQLLYISTNNSSSYIPTGDEAIKSGEVLKILVFTFGSKPDITVHVDKLLYKLGQNTWLIRHLRRSGMSRNDNLGSP